MKKTILVTGATSGIGEGIAYNFFKKGYNLILFYRKKIKIKKWQKSNPKQVKNTTEEKTHSTGSGLKRNLAQRLASGSITLVT